jgi:proteasome lid subunit RPN8/RPN11
VTATPRTNTITLPDELRARIVEAARAAYPDECCGLIEGTITDDGWHVAAIHETRNIADDPRRDFLVDPQSQFELLRALRGTGRRIIGCFHSHPNGLAVPSARDRAQAIETDFVWLIASSGPDGEPTLKGYRFTAGRGDFEPLELVPGTAHAP